MKPTNKKDIYQSDEGIIYSISREEILPLDIDYKRKSGNEYIEDAQFIIDKVEEMHPYFLTELYNFEKYEFARKSFLTKCEKTNYLSFKFHMMEYFKTLCDGHMCTMPLSSYSLDIELVFASGMIKLCDENIIVRRIGNRDITYLISLIDDYFYFENESSRTLSIPYYLRDKDFLTFAGCITSDNVLQVETNVGREAARLSEKCFIDNKSSDEDFINTRFIDDVLIIEYNSCIMNEQHSKVVKEVINAKKNGITKYVFDLRKNQGGSAESYEILLDALNIEYPLFGAIVRLSNELLIRGKSYYKFNKLANNELAYTFYKPNCTCTNVPDVKLVILTSKYTFSSAMQFACIISDGRLGYLIGEMPSGAPCSFGDIYEFQTKNLKVPFIVSHKYFLRPDNTKDCHKLMPNQNIDCTIALEKAILYLNQKIYN